MQKLELHIIFELSYRLGLVLRECLEFTTGGGGIEGRHRILVEAV